MNETDELAARSRRRSQLMARWQSGDAEACGELLDDIGPSLHNFLRRRIADAGEVEDAYQEILLAIFASRHTYEPARPFEPWLFAIARNIAVDFIRRRWSRAKWEELVAELPEQPATLADDATPELERALRQLPADQQQAFTMLKLDGLSLETAAARAGVSVGALKVRAHRAYKALKWLIGE